MDSAHLPPSKGRDEGRPRVYRAGPRWLGCLSAGVLVAGAAGRPDRGAPGRNAPRPPPGGGGQIWQRPQWPDACAGRRLPAGSARARRIVSSGARRLSRRPGRVHAVSVGVVHRIGGRIGAYGAGSERLRTAGTSPRCGPAGHRRARLAGECRRPRCARSARRRANHSAQSLAALRGRGRARRAADYRHMRAFRPWEKRGASFDTARRLGKRNACPVREQQQAGGRLHSPGSEES